MRFYFILFLAIFLSACNGSSEDKELSLKEVCDLSNGLCENFKVDGTCKNLRKDVIMLNYELKQTKDDMVKYQFLNKLEDYHACSKKASYIEYIDPKEKFEKADKGRTKPLTDKEKLDRQRYVESIRKRKSDRKSTFYHVDQMLKELTEDVSESDNPYMLYWQWSRSRSEEAIVKLLNMAENNELEDSHLLFYVSQEQIKYNRKKAKRSLLKSLELYPPENYKEKAGGSKKIDVLTDEDAIHFEIFRTLITLYYKEKNYDWAYIFAKLLKMNNDNSANTLQIIQAIAMQSSDSKIDKLDEKAEDLHDDLLSGKFSISKL